MKEQEESPEKELNEMEVSNLSDTEFKVMVIRILNSMKKDIETMKNNQAQMKNSIYEMKNTLEGIISRMDEAMDWVSKLEDKGGKNYQSEQQKKI